MQKHKLAKNQRDLQSHDKVDWANNHLTSTFDGLVNKSLIIRTRQLNQSSPSQDCEQNQDAEMKNEQKENDGWDKIHSSQNTSYEPYHPDQSSQQSVCYPFEQEFAIPPEDNSEFLQNQASEQSINQLFSPAQMEHQDQQAIQKFYQQDFYKQEQLTNLLLQVQSLKSSTKSNRLPVPKQEKREIQPKLFTPVIVDETEMETCLKIGKSFKIIKKITYEEYSPAETFEISKKCLVAIEKNKNMNKLDKSLGLNMNNLDILKKFKTKQTGGDQSEFTQMANENQSTQNSLNYKNYNQMQQ